MMDGVLKFNVNDISLKRIIVKDANGKEIYRSSRQNNTILYDKTIKEIYIEAEDMFENRNTVQLKIGSRAPAGVDYVKVYPNPASEYAVFEFGSSSNDVQIRIYDSNGKLIKKVDSYSINTNGTKHYYTWLLEDRRMKEVSNGIYFYKVIIDGQEKVTGKLAVIR